MSQITSKTVAQYCSKDIVLFRIADPSGAYAEVLNYGATLASVVVPDRNGALDNVVLHYPDINDYFSDTCYLGSSIGRVANRIAGAKFTLKDRVFKLDRNDGENCNHSGFSGFDKKVFDTEINGNKVVFSTQSRDGEGGFPGNMNFTVQFSFADRQLSIRYTAECDCETLFNPTCHAYFNLTGQKRNIFDHDLLVNASEYIEMNDDFLPTGNILPVADTAFDFRKYQSIGWMSALKHDCLKGYNACFVASDIRQPKHLASLREPASGRVMDVFSTMPGVLLYTGDYLDRQYQPFEGLCLEAQFYPDSPNHAHFPSCTITPGKVHEQRIRYRFGVLGCQT
jgi:aldose 1-epimerase